MKQNKDLILNVLLIFVIFITISGFLEDVKNTFQYGGVDLRNRVVGARLLRRNMDPYFYKWQQGDPIELLDPRDKIEKEVSMVTVPPSVLLLLSPFADIRYNVQRIIWFFIQWLLFLLSIQLFTKMAQTKKEQKLIWLLCLLFIGSSFFWRLHVERGQIYILYVALISLVFYLFKLKFNSSHFWCGLVLGIAIILRPTLVLIVLPFLIYKKWKILLGTIIGGAFSFGFSLIFSGWKVWQSYFASMKIYGDIHLADLHFAASKFPYSNIEGIRNLYGLANIPIFDSSIQFLLKLVGVIVPGFVLMLIFVILIVLIFLVLRKFKLSDSQLFLLGSIFVFLVDFFLAAPRFSYNNVMFLPIICIIIMESDNFFSLINNPQNHSNTEN